WFWPRLVEQGMAVPVVAYIAVLGAMVSAALLARLPTLWTALGGVCFAVSDAMIGISQFVRGDQLLAVPIWWGYAASLVLITAGLFFRRATQAPAKPAQ
ncbi:lysoplasmalogenase family protein, partial [Mycobacteriaceae bacterium Msp059]|nr:lysoplasmalogenase family protein [Mycobacteriaceae bacterium Msp059]